MLDGRQLGDHAAHGDPNHMGGLDPYGVQHGHAVGGHVRQTIGFPWLEPGGLAGVAVIEPHGPIALGRQQGAEGFGPAGHLGPQAIDQ